MKQQKQSCAVECESEIPHQVGRPGCRLPAQSARLVACLPTQLQPETGPTRPALILLKNCQKRLRDGDGAEAQSEREMKKEQGRRRDGEKEAKGEGALGTVRAAEPCCISGTFIIFISILAHYSCS